MAVHISSEPYDIFRTIVNQFGVHNIVQVPCSYTYLILKHRNIVLCMLYAYKEKIEVFNLILPLNQLNFDVMDCIHNPKE